MSTSGLIRGSGLAALLGGALWVVVFAIYAMRASGPGAEPPYRSFEGLGVPGVLSLLLIAFGFMGLDWPTWRGKVTGGSGGGSGGGSEGRLRSGPTRGLRDSRQRRLRDCGNNRGCRPDGCLPIGGCGRSAYERASPAGGQ